MSATPGGSHALKTLAPGLQSPAWEGLIATLAITWASNSAYATDVLWGPLAAPGKVADALVVLQGFQQDPLATALTAPLGRPSVRKSGCCTSIRTGECSSGASAVRLHPCADAEDEAQRAAACVIRHVEAGRSPVALLANDRLLTRRVSAMLHSAGVSVRDETGWKLSTTFAAAQVMTLLRAADAARQHGRCDRRSEARARLVGRGGPDAGVAGSAPWRCALAGGAGPPRGGECRSLRMAGVADGLAGAALAQAGQVPPGEGARRGDGGAWRCCRHCLPCHCQEMVMSEPQHASTPSRRACLAWLAAPSVPLPLPQPGRKWLV